MKNLFALAIIAILALTATPHIAAARETTPKIESLIRENTAESLNSAGIEYLKAETVNYDIYEAAKLFYRAAERGSYHADYWIYDLWEEFDQEQIEPPFPIEQFAKSRDRAITGYTARLKTKQDLPETYHRLSRLLDPGLGVEDEEPRFLEYLKKAADMGHPGAIEDLSFIIDLYREHPEDRPSGLPQR